jgi:DNA helicase-2/ATP-dependent DNA helicase PcrA
MSGTSLFAGTARGVSSGPATAPRRIAEGSPQQEAFWGELVAGDAHVMLEARAGTGKSTSCREGIHRLKESFPDIRTAYVAFNKSIAEEFQSGLPAGATATTMHSAGYAAIRRAIPGVGAPSKWKMHDIVDGLRPRRDPRSRKVKSAVVKLATLCKGHLIGHDPRSLRYGIEPATLDRLCASHGIDARDDRAQVYGLVPRVLAGCIERSGVVDFTDMPWLPVVLGLDFPPIDVLFVDESQDLDACQHALVRRIAGDGRLVVVGDPFQAIYLFRGALSSSMGTLGDELGKSARGLSRLPLTMTRRCPRSHVELARRVVGDFEALPEAPEGEVSIDIDPAEALVPGVMGLCRTNAPLVNACFRLAARGVPVAVQGKDYGDGLARFVDDFGASDARDLMARLESYRSAEMLRLSGMEYAEAEIETVNDRCDCVAAISEGMTTASEVSARVRSLFIEPTAENRASMVVLSSVHRAKGREADRVAILEPGLMPHRMARTPESVRQEHNLLYVGITRSKRELSFCGPLPDPIAPLAPIRRDRITDILDSRSDDREDVVLHGLDIGGPIKEPAPDNPPISDIDRKRIAYFGLKVKGA